jgi:hypothetical protein
MVREHQRLCGATTAGGIFSFPVPSGQRILIDSLDRELPLAFEI